MFSSKFITALVLASFGTYVGHARKVTIASKRLQEGPTNERHRKSWTVVDQIGSSELRESGSMNTLARLLFSFSPSASFNPSGVHSRIRSGPQSLHSISRISRTRAARAASPLLVELPSELPATLIAAASSGGLSSTADELAGSLFGFSLFPWLAMLYWLGHPTVKAPTGVTFGLTFLLAFVFGSIPAAIGAGGLYGVSLADADWLHGSAESLLAITNCVVVLGFRDALSGRTGTDEDAGTARLKTAALVLGVCSALSAVAVLASGGAEVHTPWLSGVGNLPAELYGSEPANALSVPTWIIHTSSLVEWLVAMGLAWRFAEYSDQPRWKGVTWGMLPLHTSGIVACTYHLFYNQAAVSWCVTLQALMTCIGNTTLAIACLRLALAQGWTWQMGRDEFARLLASISTDLAKLVGGDQQDGQKAGAAETGKTPDVSSSAAPDKEVDAGAALIGWEDLGDAWAQDSDTFFLLKLLALSGGLAYFVKYAPALIPGSLTDAWAGLPDEAISVLALAVIFVPTGLNVAKWNQRSQEDAEFVGDF